MSGPKLTTSERDNRDINGINGHIQVGFSDVLGEPYSVRSISYVWSFSKYCYSCWRDLLYVLCTCFCGVTISACWGCQFAFLAFQHVWIFSPCAKCFDLTFLVFKRLLTPIIRCLVYPITDACGHFFNAFANSGSKIRYSHQTYQSDTRTKRIEVRSIENAYKGNSKDDSRTTRINEREHVSNSYNKDVAGYGQGGGTFKHSKPNEQIKISEKGKVAEEIFDQKAAKKTNGHHHFRTHNTQNLNDNVQIEHSVDRIEKVPLRHTTNTAGSTQIQYSVDKEKFLPVRHSNNGQKIAPVRNERLFVHEHNKYRGLNYSMQEERDSLQYRRPNLHQYTTTDNSVKSQENATFKNGKLMYPSKFGTLNTNPENGKQNENQRIPNNSNKMRKRETLQTERSKKFDNTTRWRY